LFDLNGKDALQIGHVAMAGAWVGFMGKGLKIGDLTLSTAKPARQKTAGRGDEGVRSEGCQAITQARRGYAEP
jgi:hypothetical protein